MTGTVFDIKEFAVHDGPGPRVTVFLKGCPLRCRWCHNPEGLSPEPQLLWKKNLCVGCGRCREPCGHEECRGLGRCWRKCPKGALSLSGRVWEAEALAEKLRRSAPMLSAMGGGVTLSGGEPTMQWRFAAELLDRLAPMHRAVETCGYCSEEAFRAILGRVEYVLMDLKLADPALHQKYTGVDNAPILRNLELLRASGKPFLLRTPLIPGITDTEENLRGIAALAGGDPVELLEYNSFAPAKYAMLGRDYPLPELPAPRTPDLGLFRNVTLSRL
jgi:pyruvate formate lyase activating enzyme